MYIDTNTFWVVAVGLGIAIWVVYYTLDAKLKKFRFPDEVVLTKKNLEQLADIIDKAIEEQNKAIVENRNEQLRKNAELYGELAKIYDEFDKLKAQKKHADK